MKWLLALFIVYSIVAADWPVTAGGVDDHTAFRVCPGGKCPPKRPRPTRPR
jgi:hypothetical protein